MLKVDRVLPKAGQKKKVIKVKIHTRGLEKVHKSKWKEIFVEKTGMHFNSPLLGPVSYPFVCNHSSVGSQDEMLRKLGEAMMVPLKSGLQSFNKVSETLLSVGADVLLPDSQTFHDLRRQIVNMKEQIERSERIAAGELHNLDRQTEVLTAEQGRLARRKMEKELQICNLRQQLDSYNSSLESYMNALDTMRRNLEAAEETLNMMRRQRDEAEEMRDIGLGLLAIPVIGWVVGEGQCVTR